MFKASSNAQTNHVFSTFSTAEEVENLQTELFNAGLLASTIRSIITTRRQEGYSINQAEGEAGLISFSLAILS